MSNRIVVEIAVQDGAGARTAVAAGADRVELCSALGVGGLTPSVGVLDRVCAEIGADRVNVLVRPRAGGFVYDDEEVDVVCRDIRAAVERGVGGVVVGALTSAGDLDRDALRRWQDAAGETPVVFHRAIDASPVPDRVFDALLDLRIARVLTSGGAPRSIDGIPQLGRYVARAGADLEVMAGGGVRPADVTALVAAGVPAVHLSARGRMSDGAPSGPGGGADEGYDVTDAAIARAAVAAARGA
ncbi:copper homeostasis protein CutC [Microbacterium sp.]|uniref:copper homeostasis protein CutC n=1 Tax=Microbacterium sp. TaxID=51671 RepID=UPI0039E3AAB2